MATSSHQVMAADLFAASIAAQDLARDLGGTVESLVAEAATAIPPSAGQAPLRTYTVTVEIPDADPT